MKAVSVFLTALLILALGLVSCGQPTPTPTAPSTAPPPSPTTPTEREYIDLVPSELYNQVKSPKLTKVQKEQNWNRLAGKWVWWSGKVRDVLTNNVVEVRHDAGRFLSAYVKVEFEPSWSEDLAKLSKGEEISYKARLSSRQEQYMGDLWDFYLDHGELSPPPVIFPKVTGIYIETPETKDIVQVVSHRVTPLEYNPKLIKNVVIEVKNISDEVIEYSTYGSHLELMVVFKDISGNEIKGTLRSVALGMFGSEISPGASDTINIDLYFYPPVSDSELAKIATYEMTIVWKEFRTE